MGALLLCEQSFVAWICSFMLKICCHSWRFRIPSLFGIIIMYQVFQTKNAKGERKPFYTLTCTKVFVNCSHFLSTCNWDEIGSRQTRRSRFVDALYLVSDVITVNHWVGVGPTPVERKINWKFTLSSKVFDINCINYSSRFIRTEARDMRRVCIPFACGQAVESEDVITFSR